MEDTIINFSDGTRAMLQRRDDGIAERVIVKDGDGNVVVLAINEDITDWKQCEAFEAMRVGNLLLAKPKEEADA